MKNSKKLKDMDKIAILDFGGQYCHLISRRIRDFGVLTEIYPSNTKASKIATDENIKGIILSGGARSVYEKNAPKFDKAVLKLNLPFLGICYGHQLLAHLLGGRVVSGEAGEYGLTPLNVLYARGVLTEFGKNNNVWMNHRDVVVSLPPPFLVTAKTKNSKIAAFTSENQRISGVQFHPEVSHTQKGDKVLRNFVFNICRCKKDWSSESVIHNIIKETEETIGRERAIIGLSGGVDSSVASMLVARAIGNNFVAVYVDTGLMREGETEFIKKIFKKAKLNLKVINASKEFFTALKGITLPEKKRKIIGKLFVDTFYNIARKEKAVFLVQGTIYSDRIESGITKHSSKIKSHHNVGGLPRSLPLKLYEPLRELYKDEVRKIAAEIGLPKEITRRQVFPGPGLAVRVIGEVTPDKVKIVRRASAIIEEELKKTRSWKNIWMSFAVLLPIKSVGIQGDERSYKYPVVVRIVESRDAMTANFSKIPLSILEKVSSRITNEIREVNRVVYDVTNKPPATMEWE